MSHTRKQDIINDIAKGRSKHSGAAAPVHKAHAHRGAKMSNAPPHPPGKQARQGKAVPSKLINAKNTSPGDTTLPQIRQPYQGTHIHIHLPSDVHKDGDGSY